jgi:hypothetical protein
MVLVILLVELVDIVSQVYTLTPVCRLEQQLLSVVDDVLVPYVDLDYQQELEVPHFLNEKEINKNK